MAAHDPVLPARLPARLDAILDATCARATSIGIAVSGGADSMALALLLDGWCHTRGIALTAFTVDHGLRAESATEARQVGAWLQTHRIAHHILTPAPLPTIRNPQAQARARRYQALHAACRAQGITHLLLAHHADDQAETVALQQHRGNTPACRAAMALVTPRVDILLVRPLLGTRKAALMHYLKLRGQPWVEDPSNQSDAYARNRLRHTLTEADIVRLWHEAQHQGTLRHQQETERNQWLKRYAQLVGCTVQLDCAAWAALADIARTDALSHVIRVVGGKTFRPRHHETTRLDAQLRAHPIGQATLGHCRIGWNAATIQLAPEAARSHGLDEGWAASHMTQADRWKLLVSEPFWWFNHPLDPSLAS